MITITLTEREAEEIKTALLLSMQKTMAYPFRDAETEEIEEVIGMALEKISAEINS